MCGDCVRCGGVRMCVCVLIVLVGLIFLVKWWLVLCMS